MNDTIREYRTIQEGLESKDLIFVAGKRAYENFFPFPKILKRNIIYTSLNGELKIYIPEET